jgi:TonB-linked SusC/RagA family outer membrane protein
MITFSRQVCLALASLALAASSAAAQQPATLSGRVISEDSLPIPGASVVVQGLGISTTTRADGRYALIVPEGRVAPGQPITVLVRAINFKPATTQVTLGSGITTQDFALAGNPLKLGEIVVTGAGTQSEVEKIGNVRNYVDSTLIQRSNETNVVNALAAKAPNVEVTSTAGDPGASASIRIRGANTLGGSSEPLFIVDGVPIDNSTVTTSTFDGTGFGDQQGTYAPNRAIDLNSGDIENVEILKGAAAGSIYGARAGQGVILITTKKGRAGATTYSLHTSISSNSVTKFPQLQRSFGQGEGGVSDPCVPGGQIDCTASTRSWGPALAAGTPTFDHAREVFRNGYTTDNTLAISGGNDRTTFYLSAGQYYQQGTFVGPNNHFGRTSFRLRGEHFLSDRFKIGGNVAYASSRASSLQKTSNFSGITLGAWRSTPSFDNRIYRDPVNGMHRSFAYPNPSAGSFDQPRGYDNPFFTANVPVSTSDANRVTGNLSFDYHPIAWLSLNYTLGVDYSGDDRLQGQPQTSSNTPLATGQVIALSIGNTQVESNLLATATYKLNPTVEGTVTLGQDFNNRSFHIVGATGNGLLAVTPFSLRNTASQNPAVDSVAKVNIQGYFGQGTLDIGQQLYLKGGLRYDGASTFGQKNLRSWFPSASAAWQFTKVVGNFGNNLTYGKARVAYGEVGTQPPPYLGSNSFIGGGSFADPFGPFLSGNQGGHGGLFTPITKPAFNLKPERTKELEAGVDLGLFKDLADLSFTWYRRISSDVILSIPVAASTGYQFQSANAAKLRNSGTEWALNIRPITRKNFAWDLGFIVGTNRNRVLDLKGAQFVSYGGLGGFALSVADVGGSVGDFLDFDYVRCGRGLTLNDGAGGSYNVDANCTASQNKGRALFLPDGTIAGVNGGLGAGYPLLDPTKRIIGSPDPKWTGSVRTGVRIGKFNISGLVDVRHGGLIYNGTLGALVELGTAKVTDRRGTTATIGKDFLAQPVAGPGAGTPVTLDENFFRGYYSTFTSLGQPFYEDASFVKLREISVGYSWTGPFVTRTLGLASMELRISGRNLATWDHYSGIDPETSFAGAESGARGIDWFNNPQARSFVFNVTLNR